jgi:arylsulfatase A-like enzyme
LKRGVLNGFSPPLIERNRPTVASFLKAQGYATGIVGKWHLGLGFAKSADGKSLDFNKPIDHGPKELGFDFSFVIPASLDFPPYVYIRDGQVTEAKTVNQPAQKFPAFLRRGPRAADLIMTDVLDHLSEQAAGFIERKSKAKKRQPFFLYFPLTAPHKPVLPHPRFKGKTKLGPYGDFIVQVDWTVGQILNKLDDCGIADETLVIYTSDNGSFMRRSVSPEAARGASVDHVADETVQAYLAANHTANYEFRGTKTDIWEAGHRVPFFARWPDKIKSTSKCSKTICLTDFFATTAQIIGADVPQGGGPFKPGDGADVCLGFLRRLIVTADHADDKRVV